jgi:hypothetical protein
MSLTSSSLTNNGLTTNFHVQYETSLTDQSNVVANANALLGVVENELGVATLERHSKRRDIGVADPVRYGIAAV